VKGTGQQLRSLTSDHVLFFSYRWFAWVVAGVMLVLPGRTAAYPPREAALLLLSGIVNVIATATSINYVRITRRRWWLLSLDILGSMVFVWITNSQFWPFLPLALGSLVLPTLLYGRKGALISTGMFACLDLAGVIFAHQLDIGTSSAQSLLALRLLVPFLFVLAVYGTIYIIRRAEPNSETRASINNLKPQPERGRREQAPGGGEVNRLVQPDTAEERTVAANAFERQSASQFAMARIISERSLDATRHAFATPGQGLSVQFSAALNQLVERFSNAPGLDIHLRTLGTEQHLHLAQQQLLLRLAHESLLNVQQHAQAQAVLLTLQYEPRAISMTIQDDGVGLLDGTHERPGVHALRAMHYRLTELDGQLEVFEGQTGGVTVRATLPLEQQ
jgi:hypothetical protein